MSSKLYRFIKPSSFILFFLFFISLRLNTQHLDARMKGVASDIALATADRSIQDTPGSIIKNYAQKCVDVTSKEKQKKLVLQALASQSYLNNLVIRFDESKKKYVDTVYEMKDLTEAIEAGLVDLSKDVEEAIATERSLIRTASGILEYQYSLNEQAASVVDFLLSAPVKQKQMPLDLDFLDKKIFKEGFNPVSEYYTNEIDELLGYVPGDLYATKAAVIASQRVSAYSTSWHPSGNYVVVTGSYGLGPPPDPQLTIYNFDGTSLNDPVSPSIGALGANYSIDWSPDEENLGGYLVAGGLRRSVNDYDIRVFKFDMASKVVTEFAQAQFNPGVSPYDYPEVGSVAWHPYWNGTTGGYFAAVGGMNYGYVDAKDIQVYKIDLSGPPPSVPLIPVYSTKWGPLGGDFLSCSWSPDGEYLAVGGWTKNIFGDRTNNQVLRIFEFDSSSGSLSETTSMNYDDFDFDVDLITGLDWSPNGQYLALSTNTIFNTIFDIVDRKNPQVAMNAPGNAFAVWEYQLSGVIQAKRYDVLAGFWQEEVVTLSSLDYESLEPQVAINNNGDAIAVWKRDDGGGSCTIQANRYDVSSGSWQFPDEVTNLSLSGQNASLPQVVMNDDGGAIAVWQRPTGTLGEIVIQANRYDGVSWQDPSNVINLSDINEKSEKPQIAMNDAGDAIVVWRNFDGGGDYAIEACKYDHKSCDWLSVDTIFSGTFSSIDNPQIAMSNDIAIIVWEGKETYFHEFVGEYYMVQARANIISKGWGHPDAWEPSLNKEPEDLSVDSRHPQIAIRDYEGIAVWKHVLLPSPLPYPEQSSVQVKKYILGQGWQLTKNLTSYKFNWLIAEYLQIAMDGAGNGIVVWNGISELSYEEEGVIASRYNVATDSWEDPREISVIRNKAVSIQIAMDREGSAIVIWDSGPLGIFASRYNEVVDGWKVNLGWAVGRYSLKIVKFDVSCPELLTAWNEVQMLPNLKVRSPKWAPSGEVVAIATELIIVNNIKYGFIIFEVDFLAEILTQREGAAGMDGSVSVYEGPYIWDLAWRSDGKYISTANSWGSGWVSSLDIYDLDHDYFEVVVDTFDTSVPARGGTKWSNKGGRDVGILSNILCQNQGKDCTKSMPVKFAIPDGYLTAANFVDVINPACISADYGLTAVLDASIEVTDSLLGARKRNYKFMQDNLKLSKRLTDVYKKSIEMKKTEQARVIDQPGVYTFNKDVQGVIVIDADNITLDLNGHKIFSDSKIPITVNKNIKNICIKNGSIVGGNQYLGAPSGVLVQEGAQHVMLENLTITFCYEGVTFKGEQDCSVTDCLVEDCAFKSNIKAASLDCSEYVTFKECEFLDCFLENVNLENNNKNCYQ